MLNEFAKSDSLANAKYRERVEQLTNEMQKPTSRNETIAVDWKVW